MSLERPVASQRGGGFLPRFLQAVPYLADQTAHLRLVLLHLLDENRGDVPARVRGLRGHVRRLGSPRGLRPSRCPSDDRGDVVLVVLVAVRVQDLDGAVVRYGHALETEFGLNLASASRLLVPSLGVADGRVVEVQAPGQDADNLAAVPERRGGGGGRVETRPRIRSRRPGAGGVRIVLVHEGRTRGFMNPRRRRRTCIGRGSDATAERAWSRARRLARRRRGREGYTGYTLGSFGPRRARSAPASAPVESQRQLRQPRQPRQRVCHGAHVTLQGALPEVQDLQLGALAGEGVRKSPESVSRDVELGEFLHPRHRVQVRQRVPLQVQHVQSTQRLQVLERGRGQVVVRDVELLQLGALGD